MICPRIVSPDNSTVVNLSISSLRHHQAQMMMLIRHSLLCRTSNDFLKFSPLYGAVSSDAGWPYYLQLSTELLATFDLIVSLQ